MTVRIRLKKLGRRHRPFFRVCAMDSRRPRDGKVIEELGYYDPMVKETDARAVLNGSRIDYWLGVGAQPSDKVKVLIKKYGTNGTHLAQQEQAFERLKIRPIAPEPVVIPAADATPPADAAPAAEEPAAAPAAAEPAAAESAPEEPGDAASASAAAEDAADDSASASAEQEGGETEAEKA